MRSDAKNREIEQLRAVSICLVLVAHVIWLSPFIYARVVPLFQYASFGVGVDLFFCISGYVVAKSYCDYFDRYRIATSFGPPPACSGSGGLTACCRRLGSGCQSAWSARSVSIAPVFLWISSRI